MSKLFVCINLIVEGVGNIVYMFNRRPIVFKKLIMFLRVIFLNSSVEKRKISYFGLARYLIQRLPERMLGSFVKKIDD